MCAFYLYGHRSLCAFILPNFPVAISLEEEEEEEEEEEDLSLFRPPSPCPFPVPFHPMQRVRGRLSL